MTDRHDHSNSIDLSLLIATRDRAPILKKTLEHLRAQQVGSLRWELIVIDNGSTDDTSSVLSAAQEHLPLVHLVQPRPGKNAAMNLGLQSAQGELLVFTDDDVIPSPTWLNDLWEAANRWPDDSIFSGRIDPEFPPGTPAWMKDQQFPFATAAFGQFMPREAEGYTDERPLGANMAIRASVMQDIRFAENIGPSGKDYAMGSETELLNRLNADGHRFVHAPDARVQHVVMPHQVSVKWLLARAYRFGRGRTRLHTDYKSTRMFGVPRYMWKRFCTAWFQYATSFLQGQPARFKAGRRYHHIRGAIREYRSMLMEKDEDS